MAVPKKKTSQSRKGMRRSHHKVKVFHSVDCGNCGAKRLPHHVCKTCGHYNGRQIIEFKSEIAEEDETL